MSAIFKTKVLQKFNCAKNGILQQEKKIIKK